MHLALVSIADRVVAQKTSPRCFVLLVLLFCVLVGPGWASEPDDEPSHFQVGPLLMIYPHIEDPLRREEVALVLAQVDDVTIAELIELRAGEREIRPQQVLDVGLAMRGVESAQRVVLEALAQSWNEDMRRWLALVEMIDQDWALLGLLPILDNPMPLVYIQRDGLGDHGIEYLRACDLAVNIVARCRPNGFPFPVGPETQYTPEQRALVGDFLRASRAAASALPR